MVSRIFLNCAINWGTSLQNMSLLREYLIAISSGMIIQAVAEIEFCVTDFLTIFPLRKRVKPWEPNSPGAAGRIDLSSARRAV